MKLYTSLLLIALIMTGCKPDTIHIQAYSEDINSVINGEIIHTPVKIQFSTAGSDEDNVLPKVESVIRDYIGDNGEFSITKGDWGDIVTIKYDIPMLTAKNGPEYLMNNKAPLYLGLTAQENGYIRITLYSSKFLNDIDALLSDLNWSLGAELPAEETVIEILSDSPGTVEAEAHSVFIDNTPYTIAKTEIQRRNSVSFSFVAKDGTVYHSGKNKPVIWIKINN